MAIESLPTFTKPARQRWESIPAEIRQRLLSNVWCDQCRHETTITNFTGTLNTTHFGAARVAKENQSTSFNDTVRKPRAAKGSGGWAFARVPTAVSQSHLRRGRITARITVGSSCFAALMEPDGQLGHWFRIPSAVLKKEGLAFGQAVSFALDVPSQQPDPELPSHFAGLLNENPAAKAAWASVTVLARIDWVHWMESAKQLDTRHKRAAATIDMLEHGKKRVCCFDPSGFYSKAFCCPDESS